MPRVAVDDNKRMNLRVQPDQKATLLRAAALRNTDLTDFVLQQALREARAVIEEAACCGDEAIAGFEYGLRNVSAQTARAAGD